jgi:phosphonate transport system ATP-binding protein
VSSGSPGAPDQPAKVPAFRTDGVARRYGELVAVAPLSLTIQQSESVALVGPSGAGKTTLLHLLAGMVEPSAGAVSVLGTPLSQLRAGAERAACIGVMHQQLDLVPNLAVVHNVLAGHLGRWSLARSLASLVRPRQVDSAREALRRVGLEARLHERTSRLSGGEQQRVALARLLVQRPHALLADEPVSSLDPARADALVRLLVRMAEEGGHTLVCSLHAVDLAIKHFRRVIGLRRGVVVFDRPAGGVGREDLARLYALEATDGGGSHDSRDLGVSGDQVSPKTGAGLLSW